MARRLYIAATTALALLGVCTVACTPPLSPIIGLHLARSFANTHPAAVPRLSRRSPSPQSGTGITLADPADTLTTSTSTSGSAGGILPAGYPFPQPFDAVLGINFTSTSCPSFFNRFLADPAFRACSPLSLLLETSTTFFKAMQDSTLLPAVLDQICSAEADTCLGIMDEFARQIDQASTCGPDLRQGNALAVSALNGFRNFKLYFQAGCLKNPSTQGYCLAEAANATTPNDLYLYYLPGGTSLPSGEKPSCGVCSKTLLSTFSNYASNATLRISETYVNARNVVALSCGPSFAPMVAATKTAGALSQSAIGAGVLFASLVSAAFLPTLLW